VVLLYFGEKAVGGWGVFATQVICYGCSAVVTAILFTCISAERARVAVGYCNWTSCTVTALYCDCRVTRVKSPYGQNAESLNVNACAKHGNCRAFRGLLRLLA